MKYKIIKDLTQGTDDWHKVRSTRPTASNIKRLVNNKGVVASDRDNYIAEMKGEKERSTFKSDAMQSGNDNECIALNLFKNKYFINTKEVGFVYNDLMGCSPDALIIDCIDPDLIAGGVEIKTVAKHIFKKYKDGDKVPSEYFAQVQSSMYVCDVANWWFVVYCVELDEIWVKDIEVDQIWIDKLVSHLKVVNKQIKR